MRRPAVRAPPATPAATCCCPTTMTRSPAARILSRLALTVPAGKSKTLSLHTCHYLPELEEGEQKVTFIARLKHDGKTIESKPLTVNP